MTSCSISTTPISSAWFSAAIRTKFDWVTVVARAVKLFGLQISVPLEKANGEILLFDNRVRRFVFNLSGRFYSVVCPFTFRLIDNVPVFFSGSDIMLDLRMIELILIAVTDATSLDSVSERLFQDDVGASLEELTMIYEIICETIASDSGYFRIDHDPANENGDIHPLDHFDFFFSEQAKIKVGLTKAPTQKRVIDWISGQGDLFFVR